MEGFLEVLGSDAPTPGGGAAGAIAGATGAALIAMVGRLTVGKKGFEDLDDRMRALVESADAARTAFLELADRDAHAFDGVMIAFKMPKETDEEKAARSAAIQAGYEQAASVPMEIARAAVDLMELAEDATAMGNPQAASDGVSGAAHLYCAAAVRDRERRDQRGVAEGCGTTDGVARRGRRVARPRRPVDPRGTDRVPTASSVLTRASVGSPP